MSPSDVGQSLQILRDAAKGVGRDPAGIEVTMFISAEVSAADDPRPPWETGHLLGTSRHIANVLHDYESAGVTHVILALGRSSTKRIEAMEKIAKEAGRL